MRMNRKAALAAGASLAMAFLAACSESPTAPAANVIVPKTNFAIGDITDGPAPEAAPGVIIVCKTGNVGGDFVFTRTTEGPAVDPAGGVASNQTIATGKCLEVARDNSQSGSGSHITVTEQSAPNTTFSITACRFRGYALDGVTLNPPEDCTYVNGGDLFLNHFHGFVITYNNVFTPPGDQGCTPGYWKQDQHFDSWPAPITPSTTFTSVFGVGGTLTFLQALGLNGGDTNALWRAGAAAYLNALSGGVDYAYTTTEVIAIVNGTGAYAGLSVEARKDLLDAANNGVGGCPLN
jgi:hypothetical protein